MGLALGSGFAIHNSRAKGRTKGAAKKIEPSYGGAKPRLTSDGKAEAEQALDF
jgi:hypothetical protein